MESSSVDGTKLRAEALVRFKFSRSERWCRNRSWQVFRAVFAGGPVWS